MRRTIVIYAAASALAIFLIWNNSAAPDSLKNTSILFASIVPVLIIVLPYIISEKWSEKFHYILIYDSDKKHIINGELGNAYEFCYRDMFINLSKMPDSLKGNSYSDFMGVSGMDIIEKGILEALMDRFISEWDLVYSEWEGPNYIAFEGQSRKGLNKKVKKINPNELKSIFKHNRIISKSNVMTTNRLALPPNSELTANQSENFRTIYIENKFGKVTIEIRSSHAGVAQKGILGIVKPDPKNTYRFYTIEYLVSLTMEVRKFNRYSSERKAYTNWYDNLKQVLAKCDWEVVNKKIDQTMFRSAVKKTLDQ